MIYLISKVIVWMLLAFVLGSWLGWLLRQIKARETESRLGGDLQRSREQIVTLNTDVGNARSEVSQTRVKLTQLETEVEAKDLAHSELQAERGELQRQRDVAQERLAECEADNTQLAGELELQRGEQQNLRKQIADFESARVALEASYAELEGAHAQLATLLTEREQALETLDLASRESADQLSIANKDHLALTESKGALERQVQGLEEALSAEQQAKDAQSRHNTELTAKLSGLEEQRDKLRANHTEAERELDDVRKSRVQLESKVAGLLNDLESLKSVHEQDGKRLQAQLQQQQETAQAATAQAAAAESEVKERVQALNLLQAAYDGQQAQVERLSADVRRWRRRIPDMQAELDERDMEVQTLSGRLQTQTQQMRARRPVADAGRLSAAQQQAHLARLRAQVTQAKQAQQQAEAAVTVVDRLSNSQQQARIARLQAQLTVAEGARARAEALLLASGRLSSTQQQARIARLQAQLAGFDQPQRHSEPAPVPAATADASPASQSVPASAPASAPAPVADEQSNSVFLTNAPAQVDDLQRIKGIGPKLEDLLNSLGIYQFAQIARLQPADIEWLDDKLNFKGRIERDAWIDQARTFENQH